MNNGIAVGVGISLKFIVDSLKLIVDSIKIKVDGLMATSWGGGISV
jgi:hypothetical protein